MTSRITYGGTIYPERREAKVGSLYAISLGEGGYHTDKKGEVKVYTKKGKAQNIAYELGSKAKVVVLGLVESKHREPENIPIETAQDVIKHLSKFYDSGLPRTEMLDVHLTDETNIIRFVPLGQPRVTQSDDEDLVMVMKLRMRIDRHGWSEYCKSVGKEEFE